MAEPGNTPSLTILGGPLAGRQFVIEETVDNVLIGSDPSCRFHVPLPGVSPIHARIWVDNEGVTVYDTNSPRGLYVNDDRVNGQAPIANGDILWLGAPGDPEVVMIQCRVPARKRPAAEAPAPVLPDVGGRETVALGTKLPDVSTPPPAEELPAGVFDILEPPPFEAPEEPTQLLSPAAEPQVEPTAVMREPEEFAASVAPGIVDEELEQTTVMAASQEMEPTVQMDRPAARPPEPAAPLPPVPHLFEDETATPTPPPTPVVAAPPPAPKPVAPTAAATPPAPPPAAARPPRAPSPPTRVEARPRPAAPAARPAPRPAPPAKGGGSMVGLLAGIGVVGLLVLGTGGYFAWRFLSAPAASPAPTPEPVVQATPPVPTRPTPLPAPPAEEAATPAPEPIVEETVPVEVATAPPPTMAATPAPATAPPTTVARATPAPPSPPSPKPTPAAKTPAPAKGPSAAPPPGPSVEQLRAQQVADLLTQADSALGARRYDEASALYGQALELDPGSSRAREGRAAAQGASAVARRTFVAGRTTVQGGRRSGGGVSGFEGADVAKAPDYSGRIEFEASPRNVKPGDSYGIKVFLVNDGKKAFKIGSVTAATLVNGARSGGGPVAPPSSEVKPQARVLLQEIPGVWGDDVNAWALEVTVTSDRNDVFKNTLTWR